MPAAKLRVQDNAQILRDFKNGYGSFMFKYPDRPLGATDDEYLIVKEQLRILNVDTEFAESGLPIPVIFKGGRLDLLGTLRDGKCRQRVSKNEIVLKGLQIAAAGKACRKRVTLAMLEGEMKAKGIPLPPSLTTPPPDYYRPRKR